jgi:hypothetical protein
MSQNGINNFTSDLTVGNILINTNTISNQTADLVLVSDGTNAIQCKTSTTELLNMDDTGCRTLLQQPGFLARTSANALNVTGDSTSYAPVLNSEVWDVKNVFIGGTFTAPATGKYLFNIQTMFLGLDATQTYGDAILTTSNRTYKKSYQPFLTYSGSQRSANAIYVLADMDVGDTATLTVTISNGSKTADVLGGTPAGTYFSGILVA